MRTRRHELVIEQLAKRQDADVQRAREIFAAFRTNLRESLEKLKSDEEEAQMMLLPDDQARQRRRDIDAMNAASKNWTTRRHARSPRSPTATPT